MPHRMGQPPVGQTARRALDRWGGHRRGRLSHGHGRLLLGKRQDGEGDGGKPSLGGLLVGLLASGDSKLLEIVGYRVWTSE